MAIPLVHIPCRELYSDATYSVGGVPVALRGEAAMERRECELMTLTPISGCSRRRWTCQSFSANVHTGRFSLMICGQLASIAKFSVVTQLPSMTTFACQSSVGLTLLGSTAIIGAVLVHEWTEIWNGESRGNVGTKHVSSGVMVLSCCST